MKPLQIRMMAFLGPNHKFNSVFKLLGRTLYCFVSCPCEKFVRPKRNNYFFLFFIFSFKSAVSKVQYVWRKHLCPRSSLMMPALKFGGVYCLLLLKRSPVRSFISRFVLLLLLTTDWSSRGSLSSFLRIVTHFALRLLRSFSSSGSYSHVSTFFLLTDLHLSSFQVKSTIDIFSLVGVAAPEWQGELIDLVRKSPSSGFVSTIFGF